MAWNRFGTDLEQFWNRFGTDLEQIWEQIWNRFGTVLIALHGKPYRFSNNVEVVSCLGLLATAWHRLLSSALMRSIRGQHLVGFPEGANGNTASRDNTYNASGRKSSQRAIFEEKAQKRYCRRVIAARYCRKGRVGDTLLERNYRRAHAEDSRRRQYQKVPPKAVAYVVLRKRHCQRGVEEKT